MLICILFCLIVNSMRHSLPSLPLEARLLMMHEPNRLTWENDILGYLGFGGGQADEMAFLVVSGLDVGETDLGKHIGNLIAVIDKHSDVIL